MIGPRPPLRPPAGDEQGAGPAFRPIFAIFEGGGARGIAHFGALKGIERAKLATVGVAGASAGAIVAVLKAVGYGADDIFDPMRAGGDILSARTMSPLDLLGRRDWSTFIWMRRFRWILWAVLLIPLLPVLLAAAIAGFLLRLLGYPALLRSLSRFGFFSTVSARDVLNDIIRDQLLTHYALQGVPQEEVPALVRFRDLDPRRVSQCISLKIIATNVSRQRLEVFDQATPDVVVADAVAASCAIPFLFRAARIRRVSDDGAETLDPSFYLDGGLVSNLPVWVFAEDKRSIERGRPFRRDPPVPIVAFTLAPVTEEALAKPTPRALLRYVRAVLRTAVFGGQATVQEFIPDLTVVKLPSSLTVLGFDCSRAAALKAYQEGLNASLACLQRNLRNRPLTTRSALASFSIDVLAQSALVRARLAMTPLAQVRACLIKPFGRSSFRVVAAIGMEDDADDHLVLDATNPGAPTAFIDRAPTFVRVRPTSPELNMTKYEEALVRRTLDSLIAMPIFDDPGEWGKPRSERPTPRGILCLDSDTSLEVEYKDAGFLNWMATQSVIFSVLVREMET